MLPPTVKSPATVALWVAVLPPTVKSPATVALWVAATVDVVTALVFTAATFRLPATFSP